MDKEMIARKLPETIARGRRFFVQEKHQHEWTERVRRCFDNLKREDQYQQLQIQLFGIGSQLETLRWDNLKSISSVSKEVGCEPEMLIFLEHGLGTVEEYLEIVDKWLDALGRPSTPIKTQIIDLFKSCAHNY